METRESELRSRLEDEYEKIFPRPYKPWEKIAEDKAKDEALKFHLSNPKKRSGEVISYYMSLYVKYLLDSEAIYMVSYPEEYKKYNEELNKWEEDRDFWVKEKMK